MPADRRQVIAFRLATHGLHERAGSAEDAARSWALQDSPPGSALLAIAARTGDATTDGLYTTYNARTATSLLPRADAAAYCAAFTPDTDEELAAILGTALAESNREPREALELTIDAIRTALPPGTVRSRDDLHQQLRERLPGDILPWCPGCESHHVRRYLLSAASVHGELEIAGRAGRQPAFAHPHLPQADRAAATTELARRFVHLYGPVKPAQLADWGGISRDQAKRIWNTIEAELEDTGSGSILAADAALFADPPQAQGTRLLPPGDPFLLARDRELLFPDAAMRRKLWSASGSPGLLVEHGVPTGTWRAKKKGKTLELVAASLAARAQPGKPSKDLQNEAERIARLRGQSTVTISFV